MNDPEVVRLRRLRLAALRVRALALAFETTRAGSKDPSFSRLACASWRVVRAATGRLKAHPYARYQKDPHGLALAAHGALAWLLALVAGSRMGALRMCAVQLRTLIRQLDDARALTWMADLSDTLGRSQHELRALMNELAYETRGASEAERSPTLTAVISDHRRGEVPVIEGEWPYLAF